MDIAEKNPTVLIVGPVAPRDGGRASGGVAQHVSDLVRALHAAGANVSVYADDLTPGDGSAAQREWGCLYGPVAPKRAPLASLQVPGGVRAMIAAIADRDRASRLRLKARSAVAHAVGLRIAYERTRPDVVHYQHADLRPYWGRLAGIDAPMVVTAHSLSAFRDFDDPTLHAVTEMALTGADVVLAVTADTADAIKDRLPGIDPRVVGNGIDLATFAARPAAPAAGHPVVTFAGRVARQKGVPELIEAMALVRRDVPEATLVIAGAEEDLSVSLLAQEAGLPPEAVTATGYLEAPELAARLQSADVVALPSVVREGQPRSMMEAMAAGRPIVATRTGGVPGLLGEGEYGVLVEPGDVEALAKAIVDLLRDRDAAEALGRRAARAALAFDTASVAAQVVAAYRDAIVRHGKIN